MLLMRFNLSVASTIPPNATRPPTVPVPAPETVTGTRSRFARARIAAISAMLSGNTTRSACPSRIKLASARNDWISSGLVFVCIGDLQDLQDEQDLSCKSCKSCPSLDLHHLQFTLAENFYAVAQLGCPLKLKPLRRRAHLDLEARDRRFDVRGGVVLDVLNL